MRGSTLRAAMSTVVRAFSSSPAAPGGGGGGVSMVQGASRGIGLEFVRQLLRRSDQVRVVATCRAPDSAAELQELRREHARRLTVLPLDVTDESTIEAAAAAVGETHGSLDLLINAAGILSIPNVIQPETSLSKVRKSSLLLAYEVNAVGPILVIKHMRPFLKIGASLETGKGFSLVANMSARVGSVGDNALGGWHSYRASKTALNQLTKTASVELGKKDNIACILLHPGTVDTDLSRPFQRNVAKDKLFTREFSVQKLLSIIDNAKKTDNGKFFAWDGQEIPW
ncbi:C-factor-like [Lolium rigidum]|uniref:C-factor-like n=1 Tax=Lolium rigidum TaxID=89674 RepID=UPI001F5CD680|nr:C-factor-like [Lolium rigidum]